uniref:Pleckstrin homology, MyTH4 and FERM domain containing H1 n=1 Tax=Pavo cristatus TaxID=9049 RepID=A0A8C9L1H7_PAVCR
MAELTEENGSCMDWQKRCLALESQLFKFRLQASKIRELLAEKMQELEQRVIEAERRAEDAEKQVRVMGEEIKLANMKTSESNSTLYRKYQELMGTVQRKEDVISRLETQLEKQKQLRTEEAKIIQEKAAKIKEWVTFKLKEVSLQSAAKFQGLWVDAVAALPVCFHIGTIDKSLLSQNTLKLLTDPSRWNLSTEKDVFPDISSEHRLGCSDPTSLDPPAEPTKLLGSLTFQSSLEGNHSTVSTLKQVTLDRASFPDDLTTRFHSHCLDSSFSGEITKHGLGTSMTFPKIRTPSTPRDSIQLAKRHYSQPQSGTSSSCREMSFEASTFQPIKDSPVCHRPVEETDIDDDAVLEKMETEGGMVREEAGMCEINHLPTEQGEASSSKAGILEPGGKPPTPPLHRFPSWVRNAGTTVQEVLFIFERCSVAKQGADLLESTSGPFTCLIYRNITVPVYTTLKGKATQISNVPFLDESSGSDDDCGSHASFRNSAAGSENRKASMPGSPRATKRGKVGVLLLSSTCVLPTNCPEQCHQWQTGKCKLSQHEPMEKSGYLLKMGSQVKMWKRRWFVLRNRQIMYYKSPSDVICKPQGQMELNSSCQIVRGEGSQTFQLMTEKRTYFLTADSPNILEEWIHVLQSILRVQVTSPVGVPHSDAKPTVKGWLTKVKHGHSKLVWCALIGKTFYYYRNNEDKCPLGHLPIRGSKVEEVDRSCDSDEDYETTGGGLLSSHCTLVIHPQDQSPTYLLIRTKQEKNTWLYHLTVAAGSRNATVGTSYEQLIGKLLDAEGDPNSPLWKHPMLCYSKDGLHMSLTTLPSEALQTEALKLFKVLKGTLCSFQPFYSLGYLQRDVTLSQILRNALLQHRSRKGNDIFKAYICDLFPSLSLPRSEIGKYAIYCQRSVDRTVQTGEREAKPSRMEIVSILLRNPYHHSLPFSIPVHFMNGTYQVVGFDGSSTVDEFIQRLNQETGMRKPSHMGFSLFTDDPSGRDLEHCLQGNMKICDVISKWEQALKELHPGKYEGGTRILKLTYKNRYRVSLVGLTTPLN